MGKIIQVDFSHQSRLQESEQLAMQAFESKMQAAMQKQLRKTLGLLSMILLGAMAAMAAPVVLDHLSRGWFF